MNTSKITTIDEYIDASPQEVQSTLKTLKKLVKEELPDAEESISYGIPTFKMNEKFVIYFAGYKDHVSLHPTTEALEKTIKEVLPYKTGKGTLQFKLDKPLPLPLIKKIVKFKLKENLERTKGK